MLMGAQENPKNMTVITNIFIVFFFALDWAATCLGVVDPKLV
jgi:hypothetical protein